MILVDFVNLAKAKEIDTDKEEPEDV